MKEILIDNAAKTKDEIFGKNAISNALSFRGVQQQELFQLAREKRDLYFPQKGVEVRSVIEISNICEQNCNFCNISSYFKRKKYLLNYEQIMEKFEYVYSKGRRVFLIQSGEFSSEKFVDFVSKCIESIKEKFANLTIILCMGNLSYSQYKKLKQSGADRYILKFETSNPHLYKQIKPNDSLEKRIKCLNYLIELGFEVGTGNIVSLPNQSLKDIVNDLTFISNFKLKMASSTVFIPSESSNYSDKPMGDLNLTLNFIALLRIVYPQLLIPSTSSLEKARKGGQYLGLMAGANTVTIHDGTPPELKKFFPIYSTNRFTPTQEYIEKIVKKSQLQFCSNPL